MKKLNPNVRVADVDTFSDALVVLHKGAGIADANLDAMMARISALSDALTTAIKRDKVYSGLEEADAVRDEAILALDALLSGYAVVPLAAVSEKAKKLKAVFDKYGKAITRAKYDEESSYIESLLQDFAAAMSAEESESLTGYQELVAKLRAAEDDFKAKTAAYVKAGATVNESASAVKKQLTSFINGTFIPYLASVSGISDAYTGFALEVAARIERVNASASRKKAGDGARLSDDTTEA